VVVLQSFFFIVAEKLRRKTAVCLRLNINISALLQSCDIVCTSVDSRRPQRSRLKIWVCYQEQKNGWTALHMAVKNADVDATREILSFAAYGLSARETLTSRKARDLITLRKVACQETYNNNTALHFAAGESRTHIKQMNGFCFEANANTRRFLFQLLRPQKHLYTIFEAESYLRAGCGTRNIKTSDANLTFFPRICACFFCGFPFFLKTCGLLVFGLVLIKMYLCFGLVFSRFL